MEARVTGVWRSKHQGVKGSANYDCNSFLVRRDGNRIGGVSVRWRGFILWPKCFHTSKSHDAMLQSSYFVPLLHVQPSHVFLPLMFVPLICLYIL